MGEEARAWCCRDWQTQWSHNARARPASGEACHTMRHEVHRSIRISQTRKCYFQMIWQDLGRKRPLFHVEKKQKSVIEKYKWNKCTKTFQTQKLELINNDLLPADIGPKHVPIHSGGRLQVGYCYCDMVEFSKGPHLERRAHNSSVENIGIIVHCSIIDNCNIQRLGPSWMHFLLKEKKSQTLFLHEWGHFEVQKTFLKGWISLELVWTICFKSWLL